MSDVPFSKGDRVEVRRASSLPGGLRGGDAFYPATVLRAPARSRAQILVEYDSVASPTSTLTPLREYVPWVTARPAPPNEFGRRFLPGETVEAYAEEGWHQGTVLEVSEDNSRYLVFLEATQEEADFLQSCLRLRREWTGGGWDPPFPGQKLLPGKPSPVTESKPGKVRQLKITFSKKSAPRFKKGKTVEVCSDDEGYEGAWYTAVIVDYLGNGKYIVEYLTLKTDDETAPLREEAREDYIRPYPPRRLVPFSLLDKVDVWYNDGWWTGVISKVLNGSTYVIYFSTTNEELVFEQLDLRIHQDWINQKWVIDSQDAFHQLGPATGNLSSKTYFHKGMKVEVRSDEDGYRGSWYTAVILDSIGEDVYLVEYQTLKADDETELLKEKVRGSDIRPYPPEVQQTCGFARLEAVDAWYNDGWWMGHISQILKDLKYQVYFRLSNEEMVFKHDDLRPHLEWMGGQWIPSSKIKALSGGLLATMTYAELAKDDSLLGLLSGGSLSSKVPQLLSLCE
ncbi:hypothetical protein CDL15_Pgr016590 [Punica granatum]|uniref:Agenet domain-containing protein n=1 Tax=Punica granatum TaxID=22663 RepID=A0A218XSL2_PUNGR|nr:hypothetical protein CDL15_Pgr016590 [Punica granatum]PKI62659.1 hypothetical protein CRG98_016930 [Punica granatum]